MRWLLALLLTLIAPLAAAQPVAPRASGSVVTTYRAFNPAAEYVTAGQDEPGYRAWLQAAPTRQAQVGDYYRFLSANGVAGVVPTWQLVRTASSWRSCAADPFEVPPPSVWPNMVETLRYVRDHVVPVVGPVEPVSVYRNEQLNVCAKGAPESAHRHLYAVDLVPLRPTSRDALMRGLCAIHAWQGGSSEVGLGFYKGLRFHVDSMKYRKWGAALGDETTIGCPQVMAAIAAQAAAAKAAIAARAAPPDTPPVEPASPPAETRPALPSN